MAIDEERVHLLSQVAQMYYEQSATQEAIATALKVSRPTVSRLLREAREEGVVQIIINSPFQYVTELENELLRTFPHLKQVRVLRTADRSTVARAAAMYVSSIIRDDDVIGVSWGNTMAELIPHLPHRPFKGVTVVQLNGGVAQAGSGTNAHEIAMRFGQAFGAEVYYLQVPAIVDSTAVRDVLVGNRETARVLDLGRRTNVAVFGIGAPESHSVLVQAGYFTPQYLSGLRRRGAVGDICSRYFTDAGTICDADLNERTIGLDLPLFAEIPYALAVVPDLGKAAGALGALRGRFMNVLITNEATAREILRLNMEGLSTHD